MNGLLHKLICLAAAISVMACQKDDTIMYNNSTMGNIVDGQFISDQGNIFNIVDQTCVGNLNEMKRAFIVCDVLNRTAEGADNEYDVRVNLIGNVLTKDVVSLAEITEEMQVQDPIRVEYAWISGGYMNLYIIFPIKAESTTSHLINLVHEGCMTNPETKEEISGTYRFSLRHNSYEDKITAGQTFGYVLAGGYVSFPLNSYIEEEEAEFCIEWVGAESNDEDITSETDIKALTGKYSSDGFQHAPQSMTTKASAHVR